MNMRSTIVNKGTHVNVHAVVISSVRNHYTERCMKKLKRISSGFMTLEPDTPRATSYFQQKSMLNV